MIQPVPIWRHFPNLVKQTLQWRWCWRHACVFALMVDNKETDFPRLVTLNIMAVRACPAMVLVEVRTAPMQSLPVMAERGGGYGASLKDDYRYFYGATFGMSGREAVAREDNYCEIDPIPLINLEYPCSGSSISGATGVSKVEGQTHERKLKKSLRKSGGIVTWGNTNGPQDDYWFGSPWPHYTWGGEQPHGRWSQEVGLKQVQLPTIEKTFLLWMAAHLYVSR